MVWGGVVINDFHSSHSDSFPACHLLGFMFPVLLWPINWLYFSFRAFSGVGHDKMAALECSRSFELAPNFGEWWKMENNFPSQGQATQKVLLLVV